MTTIMKTILLLTMSATALTLSPQDTQASGAFTVKNPKQVVLLTSEIRGAYAARLASRISFLVQEKKVKNIDIIINSPGGSIVAGMFIVTAIERAKSRNVVVRCAVPRFAASMAFQILSHCSERYILPQAFVLWHPPRIALMFAIITPQAARSILTSLADWEDVLVLQLRREMNINGTIFTKYYNSEKLVLGSELVEITKGFATVVDDIRGIPDSAWTDKKIRSNGAKGRQYTLDIDYTCIKCL